MSQLPHFVYKATSKTGEPLYVGATGNVSIRVGKHAKEKSWWIEVADIDVEMYASKAEALAAERDAITKLQPRYNIVHHAANKPQPPKQRVSRNPSAVRYLVTAKRWEHGWELHIADVGVTQCTRLTGAEKMAKEYLALEFDKDPEDFDVDVQVDLGTEINDQVCDARFKVIEAAQLQADAAQFSRDVARRLHDDCRLSGAEVAQVLNVSPQRASQLLS